LESQIIGKAREINNYKAFWCVEKIKNARLQFKIDHGYEAKIALMGMAFKPNIDDLRESPAKYITQKVVQGNQEGILVVEPNITEHDLYSLTSYKHAFEEADMIVYLVAHDEFKVLPFSKEKVTLDFCGVTRYQEDVPVEVLIEVERRVNNTQQNR